MWESLLVLLGQMEPVDRGPGAPPADWRVLRRLVNTNPSQVLLPSRGVTLVALVALVALSRLLQRRNLCRVVNFTNPVSAVSKAS